MEWNVIRVQGFFRLVSWIPLLQRFIQAAGPAHQQPRPCLFNYETVSKSGAFSWGGPMKLGGIRGAALPRIPALRACIEAACVRLPGSDAFPTADGR